MQYESRLKRAEGIARETQPRGRMCTCRPTHVIVMCLDGAPAPTVCDACGLPVHVVDLSLSDCD